MTFLKTSKAPVFEKSDFSQLSREIKKIFQIGLHYENIHLPSSLGSGVRILISDSKNSKDEILKSAGFRKKSTFFRHSSQQSAKISIPKHVFLNFIFMLE